MPVCVVVRVVVSCCINRVISMPDHCGWSVLLVLCCVGPDSPHGSAWSGAATWKCLLLTLEVVDESMSYHYGNIVGYVRICNGVGRVMRYSTVASGNTIIMDPVLGHVIGRLSDRDSHDPAEVKDK